MELLVVNYFRKKSLLHERSKFSWWTVEIFMMTGPELLIALTNVPEHQENISPSSYYG